MPNKPKHKKKLVKIESSDLATFKADEERKQAVEESKGGKDVKGEQQPAEERNACKVRLDKMITMFKKDPEKQAQQDL